VALMKNNALKRPEQEFLQEGFTFLVDATKQAINAVAVIAAREIFPRRSSAWPQGAAFAGDARTSQRLG